MYYYLSFVDQDQEPGHRFVGGLLLHLWPNETYPIPPFMRGWGDENAARAVVKSHLMGLNPGGEVEIRGPLVLDPQRVAPYLSRLLTREELLDIPGLSTREIT